MTRRKMVTLGDTVRDRVETQFVLYAQARAQEFGRGALVAYKSAPSVFIGKVFMPPPGRNPLAVIEMVAGGMKPIHIQKLGV